MLTERFVAPLLAGVMSGSALHGAPSYEWVGSFTTPDGAGARTIRADGRLVVMSGADVYLQSGVSTSLFSRIGSIDDGLLNAFGASCIALSPDGATLAIGDGNFGPGASVHFVNWSSLSPDSPNTVASVAAASYEAHWAADGRLYLSGADFADTFVSVVEGVDRGAPTVTRLVSGVAGASGGVTVRNGTLYTSNGFDFDAGSGSITGDVRAFDLGSIAPGAPADFETDGVLVASALSGLSLGFDDFGNMLIGGGDFGNPAQFGFASIVDGDAVLEALAGLGAATDADEQRVSPAGANTYSAIFNEATGEILVWGFADGVVHRYAVPAPGSAAVALAIVAHAGRRRRG